jgi:hypothetical protein
MTLNRLIGFALLIVMLARLLPVLVPSVLPGWQRSARRLATTLDVAGGLVVALLILYVWLRGEPVGALLLALIGIPVFWGTWRALPAWWRGDG